MLEEHDIYKDNVPINRGRLDPHKGTHNNPNSLRITFKTDYLLSRRRIIVGNNPTISLTVFSLFSWCAGYEASRPN